MIRAVATTAEPNGVVADFIVRSPVGPIPGTSPRAGTCRTGRPIMHGGRPSSKDDPDPPSPGIGERVERFLGRVFRQLGHRPVG